MSKLMALYDGLDSKDKITCSAFDTSIDIKCLETGEVLFKGLKNKVIIPGSGLIARKLFDIDTEEVTPTYNDAFGPSMYTPEGYISCDTINAQVQEINDGIENADLKIPELDAKTIADPDNHKILLFCLGTDGCGTENSQVYPVDYRKWINPNDMVPFRYVLETNDISDDLRNTYFGRCTGVNGDWVAYYFKRFEHAPKLVQQYIDGTPIDENVYDSNKKESAETYVTLTLKITKEDIRSFFDETVGMQYARINSISLCSAYPTAVMEEDRNGRPIPRMYFKDIRPLTKLHIPNEPLIDQTKGIEIIYHIYM